MLRSAASKVIRLGRATVFMVGLSITLALVMGIASAALAGNLDPLKIGSLKNVATKTTALVGKVAGGDALTVNNPSGGPALGLRVNAGQAPLSVNPEAGKATNLDADKLDGLDSTQIRPSGRSGSLNGGCFPNTNAQICVQTSIDLPTPSRVLLGSSGSWYVSGSNFGGTADASGLRRASGTCGLVQNGSDIAGTSQKVGERQVVSGSKPVHTFETPGSQSVTHVTGDLPAGSYTFGLKCATDVGGPSGGTASIVDWKDLRISATTLGAE